MSRHRRRTRKLFEFRLHLGGMFSVCPRSTFSLHCFLSTIQTLIRVKVTPRTITYTGSESQLLRCCIFRRGAVYSGQDKFSVGSVNAPYAQYSNACRRRAVPGEVVNISTDEEFPLRISKPSVNQVRGMTLIVYDCLKGE